LQVKRHAEEDREKNKHGGMVERVFDDDKRSPHSSEQNASATSARTPFVNFKETFSGIQRRGLYCVSRVVTTKRK
jgi:hypothetical protein